MQAESRPRAFNSRSEIMSLLSFNNDEPDALRSKKSLKIIIGIGALVGVIALGSTLAASINLNSGAPVEFGQGVAQTIACDSDGVKLTPFSKFYNSEESSAFYFSSINVSGVSSNCSGIVFKLRAYMNGNSEPLYWPAAPDGDSFEFGFRTNQGWYSVDSCMSLDNQVSDDASENSVTIDWSGCVPEDAALAGQVDRLTLETSKNPHAGVFPYAVGDIGPAGGTIFYASENGFSCGGTLNDWCNYLEVAPLTGTDAWVDAEYPWSATNDVGIDSTMTDIGRGFQNTLAMLEQDNTPSYAGTISRDYRGPRGYNDWFLPSKDELYQLYLQKTIVGGFTKNFYWSSSEATSDVPSEDGTLGWRMYSSIGIGSMNFKSTSNGVRPIRAF
jgi:hypothetical protein